jgi:cytochrome c556
MRKFLLAVSAFAMSALPSVAADDPIAVRKALMASVGASAGVAGGLMKNEIPYNPAVAKAAIASINATANAYGDFFPDGSQTGGNTEASPKIWEDAAGFQAALAKFKGATAAAVEAAGKDGPADLAAFQAAIGPVFDNCKGCHEVFRVMKK